MKVLCSSLALFLAAGAAFADDCERRLDPQADSRYFANHFGERLDQTGHAGTWLLQIPEAEARILRARESRGVEILTVRDWSSFVPVFISGLNQETLVRLIALNGDTASVDPLIRLTAGSRTLQVAEEACFSGRTVKVDVAGILQKALLKVRTGLVRPRLILYQSPEEQRSRRVVVEVREAEGQENRVLAELLEAFQTMKPGVDYESSPGCTLN